MTKKLFSRRMLFLLVFSIFVLPACQKLIDYIHAHPDDGDVDYKLCNIKKITVVYSTEIQSYTVHYLFTYNNNGDPLRITNDAVGTGNPDFFFRYDKYKRLSQTIRPYGDHGNYETFNKYVYNNKNQIVQDTGYAFGLMSGDTALGDPNVYAVANYTYDSKNRITQISYNIFRYGVWSFAGTFNYVYDAAGNLPAAVHDNKLNINHTNRVWMFITRDYSVNNPFIADRYNLNSLPTYLANGHIGLVPYSGKTTIEYMCP